MTNNRFSKSHDLLWRARATDAFIRTRPALFFTGYENISGYPVFVERAEGPYVWDVDGNRYLDLVLGFGTVVLGHANTRVNDAVIASIKDGVNPTLLSPKQYLLAERLIELIPGAELVTFLKSGSDAIGAAVRLARAITKKRYVLQWGHHGWHDWCAFGANGVLDQNQQFTVPINYNDLDGAEQLFQQYRGDVACVVMMPYEIEPPKPGYLESLKALAHSEGALFIFDEVRSGFRIALGGAQEYFNIEADLAAYSKAMANGHAISALVG